MQNVEAEAPTLSDAEKVAVALASLSAPARAEDDFTLDANATWEVVSGAAIAIVDGVAKVTKGAVEEKVVLNILLFFLLIY